MLRLRHGILYAVTVHRLEIMMQRLQFGSLRRSEEFAPLTGAQRDEFLRAIANQACRGWRAVIAYWAWIGLSVALCWPPLFFLSDRVRPLHNPNLEMLAGLGILGVSFGPSMLAFVVMLRWRIRRELRRALARSAPSSCFRCGYDLSGLSAEAGKLTCPECGLVMPASSQRENARQGDSLTPS